MQEIPIVDEYLTRYDVNKVEFLIRSDRCKEGVYLAIPYESEANIPLYISKLTLYTLAQLIWCPYIDKKTTIFNPQMFHHRRRQ